MRSNALVATAVLLAATTTALGQDRAQKVEQDRKTVQADESWIYDDLDQALAEARRSGKPVMAVIRCIP